MSDQYSQNPGAELAARMEKERHLAEAERQKADWESRAKNLAAELDGFATGVRKKFPAWLRWSVFGGVVLLAIIGLVVGWSLVFSGGGDEAEAAAQGEGLHVALLRFCVALVVSWGATALSLIILTIALDWMTCRNEFLERVEEGKADPMSMAVFTIGTAIYSGAIFVGTISALSL